MTGPLGGIRVIDVASFLAAPTAATLMSDMGADVIKVEPPVRVAGGMPTTRPSNLGLDIGRESTNHGKRGMILDLTSSAGQEILTRLCEVSDVLIHNFPGHRADRFGVSWEALHAVNPRLVHATLTAYGSKGPDANRLGYDSTSFWARSGIQSLLGDSSSPPVPSLAGMGDRVTALSLTIAVLAALRQRDQTGEGQRIEVSLQRTGMWAISGLIQSQLVGATPPARTSRLIPENPLEIAYPTSDDRWLVLRALNVARDWPVFCEAVGRPEWLEEYPDATSVTADAGNLRERIEEMFLEHPLEHWRGPLDASGLIWAPVETVEEVAADPQLWANGAFEAVEHPTAGTVQMVSAPFSIEGDSVRVRRLAPAVGEHTEEILKELGYSAEERDAFAREGAIG